MSVCTEPGTESQVSHAALRLQEGKTAGKHFVLCDTLPVNTALCDTLLTNYNWSCFLVLGSNNCLLFKFAGSGKKGIGSLTNNFCPANFEKTLNTKNNFKMVTKYNLFTVNK